MPTADKKNDLIAKMQRLGYEYDSDTICILFINVEDESDLSFAEWDDVEKYINERL